MTLSTLQSELARLLYRDPSAATNVLAIENKGTAVFFSFDDSEHKTQLAGLARENAALETKLLAAMQERDRVSRALAAFQK